MGVKGTLVRCGGDNVKGHFSIKPIVLAWGSFIFRTSMPTEAETRNLNVVDNAHVYVFMLTRCSCFLIHADRILMLTYSCWQYAHVYVFVLSGCSCLFFLADKMLMFMYSCWRDTHADNMLMFMYSCWQDASKIYWNNPVVARCYCNHWWKSGKTIKNSNSSSNVLLFSEHNG